jgi:hypothetical protein
MRVLGHIMTEEGRYPDPELVRAINDLGVPIDQPGARSLVGLALVAKEYVRGMSDIIAPLQDLLRKNVDVLATWTDEIHGEALRKLKRTLTRQPVLRGIDPSKPFRIHVDACRTGRGIGAVLLQQDDEGRWHPVAYWSLKLTDTERNYSATDLECKAMHDAILHWSKYLRNGHPFEVVTDHYALVYLSTKSPRATNGRLMRYIVNMQEYVFTVIHRKGSDNLDADGISRLLRSDDTCLRLLTKEILNEGNGYLFENEDKNSLINQFINYKNNSYDSNKIKRIQTKKKFKFYSIYNHFLQIQKLLK